MPDRAIEGVDRLEETGESEVNATPAVRALSNKKTTGRSSGVRLMVPSVCLLTGWAIAVAIGCVVLEGYAASPGAVGRTPSDWPRESVIPLDGRRPTLLLFLHPFCPCSSASVDELSELVGRCRDRVSTHVVILRTRSLESQGGARIDRSLASGSGITTWQDDEGSLARRFGVLTSGHVLLYDPGGRLLYSGGITPARGHRGDSFGRSAVQAEILGEPSQRGTAPAFGCPLFESQPAGQEEVRP
jgi:hypothetical protein